MNIRTPLAKTWHQEKVYYDGDEFFEKMLQAIDHAEKTITLEMYIFSDDPIGKKFIKHLLMAHQRGVRVQVLVDGVGSSHFCQNLMPILKEKGIQVKVYHPLPFYHPWFGNLSYSEKFIKLITRLQTINRRDHRKILTIDEYHTFSGSFNITMEHSKQYFETPWRDIGISFQGEITKYIVLRFYEVWKMGDYFRYRRRLLKKKYYQWKKMPVRLNQNLRMRRYYYKEFLKRITNAKKRIWLTTPYFIPKRRLIRILGRAANNGVDVRLLISSKSDVFMFKTLQLFYFPYLIKKGVKVFQYTKSVLHSKNFIIDDWMTVGTSNLNYRSLVHDLEVDLVLQNQENKKSLELFFEESCKENKQITEKIIKSFTLWEKTLSRIFFLLKYWF